MGVAIYIFPVIDKFLNTSSFKSYNGLTYLGNSHTNLIISPNISRQTIHRVLVSYWAK